jgi:transposase
VTPIVIVHVGIDLAKNVFAVHGIDGHGKPALVRPAVARAKLQRPAMRFVPVKSIDQQARLMVHRARQGFVEARTACINRLRGLLSELGIVLPLKAATVRRETGAALEDHRHRHAGHGGQRP